MDVEFKDLSFSVRDLSWKLTRSEKTILKSVSGLFKPGQLSAILGPSGAGKSSLLNGISGYETTGFRGTLLTNGSARDERVFQSRSCYITQEDFLQPLMTAKELMMFAAKLKLPAGHSDKEREAVVSDLLHKLGLTRITNTLTEHLSGGETKRLSIALELINNPSVFFLDEPTTGLDNVSANLCLQMLRTLAHQGRTVVCTIHQPSALILALFDNVYVLAQGRCVYQGTPTGLLTFLDSVELTCPLNYNPADYVIELTDGDQVGNVKLLSTAISNGKVIWKEESQKPHSNTNAAAGSKTVGDMDKPIFTLASLQDVTTSLDFAATPCTQFITLFKRMSLQILRNKTGMRIMLLHHLICALLVSLTFYGVGNDAERWFDNFKLIITFVIFHIYTWCMLPVLNYPYQLKLMKREYFNRWYGFNAYFVALNLSNVPTRIFFSMLFNTIIYGSLNLPLEPLRFAVFCLIAYISILIAEGLGYTVGALFSVTNGVAVGPASLIPFVGLAIYGFDFYRSIPLFTRILLQIGFVRIGMMATVLTLYGLDREPLECNDPVGYCYFQNPKYYLDMLAILDDSVWLEILKLVAIAVIFRMLFYVALWKRLKR